jgi:transcriptional regulator of acetoin/glycerol metabolism
VVDKIQRAWETFIQNGTGSNAVREVIAASWKRSEGHIPIERGEAPLAPETEAVRLRSEHAALITAARPALARKNHAKAEATSSLRASNRLNRRCASI